MSSPRSEKKRAAIRMYPLSFPRSTMKDVYLSVLVLGEIPQGNVAGLGADVLNPFEPSITPR